MIASFVLVWVCGVAADAIEPSISEPAGVAACAGAAGVVDRKLAKGSVSAWCDGGDMSVKYHMHTMTDNILSKISEPKSWQK